ncbi:MAG: UDP-3-O-(3-hydroxymyristoyl)glucosamine N-acyltransferase [Phycisphaerales bacterium]
MSSTSAAPEQQQTPQVRADELAQIVQGELVGNPDIVLSTLAPIEAGGEGALTFIRSQNFAKLWADSGCQAALVTKGVEVPDHNPDQRALIIVDDADIAVVRILEMIDPGVAHPEGGVHAGAQVHQDAHVDPSAKIGPGCVIMKGAHVGANSVLMANVYIGGGAHVGEDCLLHPGVVLGDRCVLGNSCLVFANTVIGADGFGYLPGDETRGAIKVPQIGSVEIGDDVEIGACSTIDRAKFGVTRIGNRTKIDNQVHVGHNCIVGEDVLLCGRTTLGGSATIGDRTMVGGAVVLNDQASVGKDVRIAGGSIVLDAIEDNQTVLGVPAMPSRVALANAAAQRNLAQFCRKVEKSLKKLDPDFKPPSA